MDGFRRGGGWAGSTLHNTVPGMDWVGLRKYKRSLCVFTQHTSMCVCVAGWAWHYTIQAADSDIWMCWLSFGRRRTGDVYTAEKDDLMIDWLLMLPPLLSLFASPSFSCCPVAVLCLVLPHPTPPHQPTLPCSLSLTLFNEMNIARMVTCCPLAAIAIKRSTWLHLFINEYGQCLPCSHCAGSGGIWLRVLLQFGSSWLYSVTSAGIMYSNVFEFIWTSNYPVILSMLMKNVHYHVQV